MAIKFSRVAVVALIFVTACRSGADGPDFAVRPEPELPAACASAWDDDAVALMADLAAATTPSEPIWGTYGLDDGTYAVLAADSTSGVLCLGLQRSGKTIAYAAFDVKPKMLTPLYGYFLTLEGNGGPFDELIGSAMQPDPVKNWLLENGVDTAVIIPVRIEGLPFEIPRNMIVQTAIHEAFHIEVQAPGWMGPGGEWPVWDLQPDRSGVDACYNASESVKSTFAEEKQALQNLIVALLDEEKPAACAAGLEFLSLRESRYGMLGTIQVEDHAGMPGSCEAAETLMELEEGAADFGSWSALFHTGTESRESLLQRYGAIQNEVFYLTGAMQLHAVYLMNPEAFIGTSFEMAASESPDEGSITAIYRRTLGAYCE